MKDLTQYEWCGHCGGINSLLDHICCRCGWNNEHNRKATPDEASMVVDKMDRAINHLKSDLGLGEL